MIAAAVNGFAAYDGAGGFAPWFVGGLLGALACVMFMQAGDCYQLPALRAPFKVFFRVQGAVILSFALIAGFALVFFPDTPRSRDVFITWYALCAIALFAGRTLLGFAIGHWWRNGVMERRAVIVGGGDMARISFAPSNSRPTTISASAAFSTTEKAAVVRPMSSPAIPSLAPLPNWWSLPG